MSDHGDSHDLSRDRRMGTAILKGVAYGMPISLIGLTIAIWLITDLDLVDAFATALLPGTLLGGFAGGFVGVASTMD